jgi:hypothetical protein
MIRKNKAAIACYNSPNLLFINAEISLEGPSKGAPLKLAMRVCLTMKYKFCNNSIKMIDARLTHSEIKQQRRVRGESPHLNPSIGVELPFTNSP